MEKIKKCSRCKDPKPYSDFPLNSAHTSGRASACNSCLATEKAEKKKEARKYNHFFEFI